MQTLHFNLLKEYLYTYQKITMKYTLNKELRKLLINRGWCTQLLLSRIFQQGQIKDLGKQL